MNKQKIDIKSLTTELKKRSISNEESNKEFNEYKKSANSLTENHLTLIDLISKVNSRKDFQMDKFIYVDHDIHEVFNKIKSHTKLKLSYLASYLLEEFIIEYQDEIKDLLSNRQNKFLDK